MKKFILILMCFLILFISGCVNRDLLDKSKNQSNDSSSSSEEVIIPQEEKIKFNIDDALLEEIVLNFGAEKIDNNIQPLVVSLYYLENNLTKETISPIDYFSWQFGYVSKLHNEMEFEEFAEKYKSPFGENTGWFYPEYEYEVNVMKYFDVSKDYLRSDMYCYNSEHKGYCIDGGGGIGASPTIKINDYTIEKNNLNIYLTLTYSEKEIKNKILSVTLEENGYKYYAYINGVMDDKIYLTEENYEKAISLGYSKKVCDFIKKNQMTFSNEWLNKYDAQVQKDLEKKVAEIGDWLYYRREELEENAYDIIALSNDGKKVVFGIYYNGGIYPENYYIWHNTEKDENRLIPYNEQYKKFNSKNSLFFYEHNYLKNFDLDIGETIEENTPKFDFGRKMHYQSEKVIVGFDYDENLKKYIVLYEDFLLADEKNNKAEVKIAVFDDNGEFINNISTGELVPMHIKNSWLYASDIAFEKDGNITIKFSDMATIKCNYLEEKPVGTILDEKETLSLFKSFEGEWQSNSYYLLFELKENIPYINGTKIKEIYDLSENKYRLITENNNYIIDTGKPRDNKITVKIGERPFAEYKYIF